MVDINREGAKQFALRIVEGERGYLLVNPTGKTLLKLGKSRRYVKNLLSLTPYLKLALEAAVGKTPRDAIAYNVKAFINYIKGVDALDAELLLNQVEAYEKLLERCANS
ncbi:hypothetical protein [Thermoproteus tenax]|uniref:Uncharacterized protein n=1 Tax=Thermoproteus tenax (strain ATCC 35583 / DSM 2078 / JCM 9277 / NBRC 100435 / Kra 1) TaxID=768679 RepID=G4RK98_THETK|nr:hypothetical protein [Thermoproteus tenax]CCC81993.1 hypothetical protein TTX_1356 [Thermoproteus tenax Kra 1]